MSNYSGLQMGPVARSEGFSDQWTERVCVQWKWCRVTVQRACAGAGYKLQAHLSLLCFGYYKLHLSFVSCFLLAFSAQDIGEGLKGREKRLVCLCHSGNSPSLRHHLWVPASALGDTPSTSLTASPPLSLQVRSTAACCRCSISLKGYHLLPAVIAPVVAPVPFLKFVFSPVTLMQLIPYIKSSVKIPSAVPCLLVYPLLPQITICASSELRSG